MNKLQVAVSTFTFEKKTTEEEFFKKVEKIVKTAKNKDSKLVVLPELITLQLAPTTEGNEKVELKNFAESFTPKYIEFLQNLAKEEKIIILGGSTPRLVKDGIRNTAVLVFPEGRTVLQDKIYLTPAEKSWGWDMGETLKIIATDWGDWVITTCFDSEFSQISQKLAAFKPSLILVPSWTSSPQGFNRVDWSAKSLAVTHYAYVLKTGIISESEKPDEFGNAAIIKPQEEVFGEIEETKLNHPSLLIGTIDFKLLKDQRETTGYFPSKEQEERVQSLRIVKED